MAEGLFIISHPSAWWRSRYMPRWDASQLSDACDAGRHSTRAEPQLLPLVCDDDDPLGVKDLATNKMPLEDAPRACEIFQKKPDGAVKIVLTP